MKTPKEVILPLERKYPYVIHTWDSPSCTSKVRAVRADFNTGISFEVEDTNSLNEKYYRQLALDEDSLIEIQQELVWELEGGTMSHYKVNKETWEKDAWKRK